MVSEGRTHSSGALELCVLFQRHTQLWDNWQWWTAHLPECSAVFEYHLSIYIKYMPFFLKAVITHYF